MAAVSPHPSRPRAEHRRETARFWRENRADAALRERFVVAAEEYARFAAALEKAVGAHEEREEENIRQVRGAEPPANAPPRYGTAPQRLSVPADGGPHPGGGAEAAGHRAGGPRGWCRGAEPYPALLRRAPGATGVGGGGGGGVGGQR